jgi:hypothetical protein
MAQADCITTAIRELMSRGEPPKSTSPRATHTDFVAGIAGNPPPPTRSNLKAEDLERRADHLQRVFAALQVCVTALTTDAAQTIPGSTLDRFYLDPLFQQLSAETLSVIQKGAAELRLGGNWSGS